MRDRNRNRLEIDVRKRFSLGVVEHTDFCGHWKNLIFGREYCSNLCS